MPQPPTRNVEESKSVAALHCTALPACLCLPQVVQLLQAGIHLLPGCGGQVVAAVCRAKGQRGKRKRSLSTTRGGIAPPAATLCRQRQLPLPPGAPWQCRPPSPVPSIMVSTFSTSCSGAALPLGEDRAVAGSTAGCGSSRDCRCRWPEGWRAGCRVLNGAWGRVLLSLPRREGAPDRRCAWQLGARALAVSCAAIGAGDENSSLKCTA